MSLIWLQVGQCGNQIGNEWWQILNNNASEEGRYNYFSRDNSLNAICVDSEPKVIRKIQKQVKKRTGTEEFCRCNPFNVCSAVCFEV
ncbi:tubulin delta chain-like isoform X2 [Pelobates cultripes]|uniref:Tubulin delta chain-like isoform X2 n=1 Tax=Pelobates cultripes TaxID=61616 RepID=A0AAD1S2Q8_PELCU|nr:tubulin delta chain-like isoform X2 [Pelobates cultripes]